MPDEQTENGRWHIERKVNVGHIIATLTLAGSIFWWGNQMDTRLTAVETRQAGTRERLDRAEVWSRESMAKIENQLQRIEDKLDRKMDK